MVVKIPMLMGGTVGGHLVHELSLYSSQIILSLLHCVGGGTVGVHGGRSGLHLPLWWGVMVVTEILIRCFQKENKKPGLSHVHSDVFHPFSSELTRMINYHYMNLNNNFWSI